MNSLIHCRKRIWKQFTGHSIWQAAETAGIFLCEIQYQQVCNWTKNCCRCTRASLILGHLDPFCCLVQLFQVVSLLRVCGCQAICTTLVELTTTVISYLRPAHKGRLVLQQLWLSISAARLGHLGCQLQNSICATVYKYVEFHFSSSHQASHAQDSMQATMRTLATANAVLQEWQHLMGNLRLGLGPPRSWLLRVFAFTVFRAISTLDFAKVSSRGAVDSTLLQHLLEDLNDGYTVPAAEAGEICASPY